MENINKNTKIIPNVLTNNNVLTNIKIQSFLIETFFKLADNYSTVIKITSSLSFITYIILIVFLGYRLFK